MNLVLDTCQVQSMFYGMEVEKDIFRGGDYLDQSGEQHTFTDSMVVESFHNARRMLDHAEPWVPAAIWEHDWNAVPVPLSKMLSIYETDRERRAGTARNCFGHLKAVELRNDPKSRRPVLWATLEIPDRADAERWKKVRWCSPRIDFDAVDPFGRQYPGASIFHIAATTKPIQIDQNPVMLSAWSAGKRSMFLSRDASMAKEDDDKAGAESGTADLTRLKDLCTKAGFPIPDSATDMNSVLVAFEAGIMAKGGTTPADDFADDDGDGLPNADDATPEGRTTSVSPAMLSALLAKIPDAEGKKLLETGAAALTMVTGNTRAALLSRFNAIEKPAAESGLATPVELAKLKQRLTAVKLSFMPTGEVVGNSTMRELDVLERAVKRSKLGGGNANGTGKTKSKTGSISLGGFGEGTADRVPAPVNEAEFEEMVKKAAAARADAVAPLALPAKK